MRKMDKIYVLNYINRQVGRKKEELVAMFIELTLSAPLAPLGRHPSFVP